VCVSHLRVCLTLPGVLPPVNILGAHKRALFLVGPSSICVAPFGDATCRLPPSRFTLPAKGGISPHALLGNPPGFSPRSRPLCLSRPPRLVLCIIPSPLYGAPNFEFSRAPECFALLP